METSLMPRRELMKCALLAAPATLLGGASAADAVEETGRVPDARLTAPLRVPASGDIRAAFLISFGAEVVDFAGPWGVFEYVNTAEAGRNPFKLYTVAASKDPVAVSGGMTVMPDHTYADAPRPNIVVVPAMYADTLAPTALDWLRSVYKDADVIMSVCNGSYIIAQAGLLDGKT